MAGKFLDLATTETVRTAQVRFYGSAPRLAESVARDVLGPEEAAFIQSRDSFYLSTVNADGWPYVQHRGGAAGFLRVVSPGALAFADYRGNRQLLSTGNLAANDRAALFLMDYPRRTRLKILGRVRVEDARQHPELVAQFAEPEARPMVERIFTIEVVAFDWNCPKHITPRYTAAEIAEVVAPLKAHIAELEAQLISIGAKRAR